MLKFRFYMNYEKEEKWLSQMAERGYQLTNKNFLYQFKKGEKEQEIYKVDFHLFYTKGELENYKALFEDCGWEHVSGTKLSGSHYFRKIDDESDESIFSDQMSKAERYKRISNMFLLFLVFAFILAVIGYLNGSFDPRVYMNPKYLYLTPGLWEKTGEEFVRAFRFETPFAIWRGFLDYLFLGYLVGYAFCAMKARQLYRKDKSHKVIE